MLMVPWSGFYQDDVGETVDSTGVTSGNGIGNSVVGANEISMDGYQWLEAVVEITTQGSLTSITCWVEAAQPASPGAADWAAYMSDDNITDGASTGKTYLQAQDVGGTGSFRWKFPRCGTYMRLQVYGDAADGVYDLKYKRLV